MRMLRRRWQWTRKGMWWSPEIHMLLVSRTISTRSSTRVDGALVWEKRDGTADFPDKVTAIALDSRDNVIVSGTFGIAKYASLSGALLWGTRSNVPGETLRVAPDGTVVIAGRFTMAPHLASSRLLTAKRSLLYRSKEQLPECIFASRAR